MRRHPGWPAPVQTPRTNGSGAAACQEPPDALATSQLRPSRKQKSLGSPLGWACARLPPTSLRTSAGPFFPGAKAEVLEGSSASPAGQRPCAGEPRHAVSPGPGRSCVKVYPQLPSVPHAGRKDSWPKTPEASSPAKGDRDQLGAH